jgi:hypothetical protein
MLKIKKNFPHNVLENITYTRVNYIEITLISYYIPIITMNVKIIRIEVN